MSRLKKAPTRRPKREEGSNEKKECVPGHRPMAKPVERGARGGVGTISTRVVSPSHVQRCEVTATSALESGFVSFDKRCKGAATESGYCTTHQYQGEGRMCKGKKKDGVQCIAEATDTGYCCRLHNPMTKRFVQPDELRISITAVQRQAVAHNCGYLDAYTMQPIEDEKHLDHVVEHQLAADCISNAWRSRREHCGSDDVLQDAILLIRDGPANATTNLRDTSAYINTLKGDACKQFIEARHTSDIVQTFTDTLMQANSTKFKGKKLTRETSGAIRKTLKSELKSYRYRIDGKNDNDLTLDAIVEEFKRLRVAVNK